MKDDLTQILSDWPFDPSSVNARMIEGADGRPKIQLRLDLGILQMETSGRPDGTRPRGAATALDYHRVKAETTRGSYFLDGDALGELQSEAVQYYYRYLARFNLRDYPGVLADTQHNMDLFHFVERHVEDEDIVWDFIQFMPYVLMMNARAKAEILAGRGERDAAVGAARDGIAKIEDFWTEQGEDEAMEESHEVEVLRELVETLQQSKPRNAVEHLREELAHAIRTENFERAAKLRDDLRKMDVAACAD